MRNAIASALLILGALLFSGCSNPIETIFDGQTYENEDIGLTINFPESVDEFKVVETILGHSAGIYPIYRLEFGRDKYDFSGEAKNNKGNLLSVYVFNKTFCKDPRIEGLQKDFCDTHRDVDSKGSWEGYYSKEGEDTSYWITKNKLLYQFDVDGSDETRNNEKKSFIEQLDIKIK